MQPSHAVTNANYRVRYVILELIDEGQQIAAMIPPAWIIAEKLLVHDTTLALVVLVGDPDTSNFSSLLL